MNNLLTKTGIQAEHKIHVTNYNDILCCLVIKKSHKSSKKTLKNIHVLRDYDNLEVTFTEYLGQTRCKFITVCGKYLKTMNKTVTKWYIKLLGKGTGTPLPGLWGTWHSWCDPPRWRPAGARYRACPPPPPWPPDHWIIKLLQMIRRNLKLEKLPVISMTSLKLIQMIMFILNAVTAPVPYCAI